MADSTVKPNTVKLVTAHARNLHIAPRKMRLVTNLVKGMQVSNAITQLAFVNKKAAPMVEKLLKSAVANAEHNFSLKGDDLVIKTITCDMGPTMKRYFPRARGSAFVIQRKTSHVHVVLEERPGKPAKKKAELKVEKTDAPAKKTKKEKLPEVSQPVAPEVEAKEQDQIKTSEQQKSQDIAEHRRPQS